MTGKTFEQFASDFVLRAATERFLEIVCEASRNVPDEVKQQAPAIDWRKMIDFGNVLRHAYNTTKVDVIWDIVQHDLPKLRSFVERHSGDLEP